MRIDFLLFNIFLKTTFDEKLTSKINPSNGLEGNTCSTTPATIDQSQIANETLTHNLLEMITNELRRVRNRISDSDEASQDRHNQLMQLLFSTFNLTNSNNQKRL